MFDIFKETYTKNYANFNGRAGRREYWSFAAMFLIVYIVLAIIAGIFTSISSTLGMIFGLIILVFALGSLIPGIGLAIRRMHDVGKSGWFCLIPIYNLVLALTPGDAGANEYGPNPDSVK